MRANRDGRSGNYGSDCRNRDRARKRRCTALLARSGSEDISHAIHGQGRDFFLGCAVQHEALTLGRDAINQPTAIGAGDEITLIVESQSANLRLVALKEEVAITVAINTKDLAAIAGTDVKLSLAIECQRPDVLPLRIKDDAGAVAGIHGHRRSGILPG